MIEPTIQSALFQWLHSRGETVREMRTQCGFNKKGVTLVELLIGLVIFGVVVAGIYRLLIAQGKAYTVQDQVAEVQQNIRTAMEIMLRDLRMAGYDSDAIGSVVSVPSPPVTPGQTSVTVFYEHNNILRQVTYSLDASSQLKRNQLPADSPPVEADGDPILENVEALTFTYGVDGNEDGAMDDLSGNGSIDDNDWVSAGAVGTRKVVAIRVFLSARPAQVNPDLQPLTPRQLISTVTLRNLALR
jgi:prepilin-type N-terminal cleavage/methylation domain-containing protein